MLSPQGAQGFLSRIHSTLSVHPLITFEYVAVQPPSVMVFSLSQLSTVKRDFCPPCALWSIRARTCDQASHFYFSTFHHFWMKSGIYPHSWKCSSCIWKIWCEVCSTHENMKIWGEVCSTHVRWKDKGKNPARGKSSILGFI